MDSRPAPAPARLSLLQWIVLLLILLAILAVGIPGLVSSGRASRERYASTALKNLSQAEAEFRANDRDWNHVNDYWTGDVKGLYTMTSAGKKGALGDAIDPAIKLIALPVAAADADGSFVPAGGENMPLSAFAAPAVCEGFWYAALTLDLTISGSVEATYRRDTGGTPAMGSCHNTSRFGFVAFPDNSWKGQYVFMVNENNTVFREAANGNVRLGTAVPPGLQGCLPEYRNWPTDQVPRTYGLHGPD